MHSYVYPSFWPFAFLAPHVKISLMYTALCGDGVCDPLLAESCVSCPFDCMNKTCGMSKSNSTITSKYMVIYFSWKFRNMRRWEVWQINEWDLFQLLCRLPGHLRYDIKSVLIYLFVVSSFFFFCYLFHLYCKTDTSCSLCSEHGACALGVCVCYGSWSGPACDGKHKAPLLVSSFLYVFFFCFLFFSHSHYLLNSSSTRINQHRRQQHVAKCDHHYKHWIVSKRLIWCLYK